MCLSTENPELISWTEQRRQQAWVYSAWCHSWNPLRAESDICQLKPIQGRATLTPSVGGVTNEGQRKAYWFLAQRKIFGMNVMNSPRLQMVILGIKLVSGYQRAETGRRGWACKTDEQKMAKQEGEILRVCCVIEVKGELWPSNAI